MSEKYSLMISFEIAPILAVLCTVVLCVLGCFFEAKLKSFLGCVYIWNKTEEKGKKRNKKEDTLIAFKTKSHFYGSLREKQSTAGSQDSKASVYAGNN